MLKAYQYRIYPSDLQKEELARAFGSCRFVYNKALDYRVNLYKTEKKSVKLSFLNSEFLQSLKEEFSWLKNVPSQSLQQAIIHLDKAYKTFFKNKKGFPKFKNKYARQSFALPQFVKVDFKTNNIILPKIGKIKASLHRFFSGVIKTCTVSKTPSNKYYISVLVDNNIPLPEKSEEGKEIGIDLGIKDYAIFSTGEKLHNPKFLDKLLSRVKYLQKALALKTRGSNNYNKLKLRIAVLHEKIVNCRKNFLHKLSKQIINENQVIILENLSVKKLMENNSKTMARNIADVSWAMFINMLKYKAEWYGKIVKQIDKYYPSSKLCSCCGYKNNDLKLSDRECNVPNVGHCTIEILMPPKIFWRQKSGWNIPIKLWRIFIQKRSLCLYGRGNSLYLLVYSLHNSNPCSINQL